jgi:nuclear transport factor 2 (NTF2) superfamily protein
LLGGRILLAFAIVKDGQSQVKRCSHWRLMPIAAQTGKGDVSSCSQTISYEKAKKRRNEMTSQSQASLAPPFTRETAIEKVRKAEDGWNSRDPQRVALAYTVDSRWRNRSEFINGREQIVQFLTRKWNRELDYRLIKEMWAYDGARIAVRFAYEWHDDSGQCYRSYGNENWEFNAEGIMHHRYASINDLPIRPSELLFHWPFGRRPDEHPGLSDLGL